ncbi:hypothetical protein MMC22_009234 [Lobaria immixta]|nr:hypothetical protein [Lobaria immixta]
MGIYHKASIHTSENTFIVLNPSKQFQGRFNECAASATATSLTPHDVQIMLLSSVTNTWMRYTGHLEQQFNMIKTKANLSAGSQGHGSSEKASSEIQISDAQDIQVLREKLYQLNQVLGMNCDVFRGMKDSFNLKSVGRVSGRRQGNQFISSALSDTQSERQRVNNTLQKLCGTSELVRNILDVCALKALEANSRTTTDISIRAESGNRYMLDLTEKARKDARTLKTITILTLIYLPASFVATFLGTGYISLHVDRQRISMQFAHEMWIFGILTITFLSLTIGIWKWREHRNIKEDLEAVPRTA